MDDKPNTPEYDPDKLAQLWNIGSEDSKTQNFPNIKNYKIIEELYSERAHLDEVIRALESLRGEPGDSSAKQPPAPRRGRRSMSQEERREVSKRMRKYWQKRRNK